MDYGLCFKVVLTVLFVFGTLSTIGNIGGEPKKPLGGVAASIVTLINGAIIWGIWGLLK